MIAVDTNILVYAHRAEMPWHEPAATRLSELVESRAGWAIPWPCVHEFFGTVTQRRIFPRASTTDEALSFLTELLCSPGLVLLAEVDGYWDALQDLVRSGRVVGPMVHDARIAALCLVHGVSELWTADRDFGRFPRLKARNPLVD